MAKFNKQRNARIQYRVEEAENGGFIVTSPGPGREYEQCVTAALSNPQDLIKYLAEEHGVDLASLLPKADHIKFVTGTAFLGREAKPGEVVEVKP